MYDVLTIGSAVVDIFIKSDQFHLKNETGALWLCEKFDEKIDVDSFKVTTGGGGSNTAVGFARFGFKTGIIAELGTDVWAGMVVNDLEKEAVDTSLLIKEHKEETGGSIILLAPDDGRTVMVHRGAASMLDAQDIPELAISNSWWIHLSSISGQLATLQKIFMLLGQYQKQFSWNPGKAEIELLNQGKIKLDGLKVTALFVNQVEWESLAPVQDQLHQHCVQIIVTDSDKGGRIYQQGEIVHQYQRQEAQTVDGTGAGDSFAVGYVAAILNGINLHQQANWGRVNAASVIGHLGAKAGLLSKEELEKSL